MSDRRTELNAIADVLRRHLDESPSAYIAPIAKQLAAVLKELDDLPNGEAEVTELDAIRAERAARSAENSAPAGRRNQQRRRGRVSAG